MTRMVSATPRSSLSEELVAAAEGFRADLKRAAKLKSNKMPIIIPVDIDQPENVMIGERRTMKSSKTASTCSQRLLGKKRTDNESEGSMKPSSKRSRLIEPAAMILTASVQDASNDRVNIGTKQRHGKKRIYDDESESEGNMNPSSKRSRLIEPAATIPIASVQDASNDQVNVGEEVTTSIASSSILWPLASFIHSKIVQFIASPSSRRAPVTENEELAPIPTGASSTEILCQGRFNEQHLRPLVALAEFSKYGDKTISQEGLIDALGLSQVSEVVKDGFW